MDPTFMGFHTVWVATGPVNGHQIAEARGGKGPGGGHSHGSLQMRPRVLGGIGINAHTITSENTRRLYDCFPHSSLNDLISVSILHSVSD